MGLSISGINQISNLYAPVSGFNAPNWTKIPHRGMEALPEDELIRRTKEIGVKSAHATTDEEKNLLATEANNLMVQYMSSVSPDRKALYMDAMQVISQHQTSIKQKPSQRIKTIYDFLNERDGIKTKQYDLTNVPEPLPSGGSVSASSLMGGGFSYSIELGGASIMSTTDNNWHYSRTPEECKKAEEFLNIYNNAVDGERYKQSMTTSSESPQPALFEMKV